MEDIVELNVCLTDIRIQPDLPRVRRQVHQRCNAASDITLGISKLACEGALLEVEPVAVVPAR
jgi:hypothetical protein